MFRVLLGLLNDNDQLFDCEAFENALKAFEIKVRKSRTSACDQFEEV